MTVTETKLPDGRVRLEVVGPSDEQNRRGLRDAAVARGFGAAFGSFNGGSYVEEQSRSGDRWKSTLTMVVPDDDGRTDQARVRDVLQPGRNR